MYFVQSFAESYPSHPIMQLPLSSFSQANIQCYRAVRGITPCWVSGTGLWHPISQNGFESISVNPTFAWKPEFFADIFLFQACTFGGQHGREWGVYKSQPKSLKHSGLVRNDFNFSFFFSEIAQMPWHFIHFKQMMIHEYQIPSPYASITALSTSRCQASEKLPEFSVTQVSLWSRGSTRIVNVGWVCLQQCFECFVCDMTRHHQTHKVGTAVGRRQVKLGWVRRSGI